MASSSSRFVLDQSNLDDAEKKKLKEIRMRTDITNMVTLVQVYSEATDAVERKLLLGWLTHHVSWFSKQDDVDFTPSMIEEYTGLASIRFRGQEEMTLMKKFLFTLIARLREETYCTRYVVIALDRALNMIDPKFFQEQVTALQNLLPLLLALIDPTKKSYTKKTYIENGAILFALHQTIVILQKVAPNCLTDEIFDEFLKTMKAIEKSEDYYPYVFYARMLKRSIKSLKKKGTFGPWAMAGRRLFYGMCGSLCLLQGITAAIHLDVDVDAFEKAYNYFSKLLSTIEHNKWSEQLQNLLEATKKSLETNDFRHFQDQLTASNNRNRGFRKEKHKRMFHFSIIYQLGLLATDGHCDELRRQAMDELLNIIASTSSKDGWLRDPHLFEAMLDTLYTIHVKGKHDEVVADSIHKLVSLADEGKLREKVESWKGQNETIEDVLDSNIFQSVAKTGELFKTVRQEKGFTPISEDSDDIDELKRHYQSTDFTNVVSLFDEWNVKHVKDLEYNVMRYEEVPVTRRGIDNEEVDGEENTKDNAKHFDELAKSKQRVVKSVTLENMMKTKARSDPKTLSSNDKKYLLLGSPGTGKTSITKTFAHGWATGHMGKDFETVYLLRIRDLTDACLDNSNERKMKTLATAIANECFTEQEYSHNDYEALRERIDVNLEKTTTLLVLDGLDEGDKTGKAMVRKALRKNCHLLLTSRPYNLNGIRPEIGIEMECLGLDDRQLIRYIQGEVKEGADELINHFRSTTSLWEVAHVPITVGILCCLWNERQETCTVDEAIHKSRLRMYDQVTRFVWERYVRKHNIPEHEIPNPDTIFDALKRIAFYARVKGEILISQDLVRQHSPGGVAFGAFQNAGFLLLQLEGSLYQFAHLSFQEYFAGLFLAAMLFDENPSRRKIALDFIAENKYKKIHWDTLSFMTQKVTDNYGTEALVRIMDILDDEPRDVIGTQHTFLKLRMIDAFLSIEENPANDNVCYACCEEVVHVGSKIFLDIVSTVRNHPLYRNSDLLLYQERQLPNVMKKFPRMIIPAFEMAKNCLDNDKLLFHVESCVDLMLRFRRICPAVLQMCEDSLCHAYEFWDEYKRSRVILGLSDSLEVSSYVPQFCITLLSRGCRDLDNYVRSIAIKCTAECMTKKPMNAEKLWGLLIRGCSDASEDIRESTLRRIADCVRSDAYLAKTALDLMLQTAGRKESSLLDEACNDTHRTVRVEAMRVVVNFAVALQDKSKELRERFFRFFEDSTRVQRDAFKCLRRFASVGEENAQFAWKLLLRSLEDRRGVLRKRAVNHMIDVAQFASIDEASVLKLLKIRFAADRSLSVLEETLYQISRIVFQRNTCSEDAFVVISRACNDVRWEIRFRACRSISDIADRVPTFVVTTLKILKTRGDDKKEYVRQLADEGFSRLLRCLDFRIDASAVLSIVRGHPNSEIREKASLLERRVAMNEEEGKEDYFKSLVIEWLEYDNADEYRMANMEKTINNADYLMVQIISDDMDSRGYSRSRQCSLLERILNRVQQSNEIPAHVTEARRLLYQRASDHVASTIQGLHLEALFEYYWSTQYKDFFVHTLSRRFLNFTVTVTPRSSQMSEVVICEASSEVRYIRSHEEVWRLVSEMKKAVRDRLPSTISSPHILSFPLSDIDE